MKANVVRWAILALTVVLLAVIQRGAYKIFFDKKDPYLVQAYEVNLKAIQKVWERKVEYPTPGDLVSPIQKIFNPTQPPPQPPGTNDGSGGNQGGEDGSKTILSFDILAVLYPLQGKGVPMLLVGFGAGEREYFARGEEMPDGRIFQAVRRVGEREYRLDFRDEDNQEIKTVEFKGEDEE